MLSQMLLKGVLLVSFATAALAVGKYDPCNTPGLASRNSGFFVGLAFWPGGSVEEWGAVFNTTTEEFGLHPCNTSGNYSNTGLSPARYLESQKAVFATFEVKVDALTILTINKTDVDALINASTATPFISVIAFRGLYRSEAAYIYSSDLEATQGLGYVTSLSLIATFSRGNLTYLQWSDFSCNTCGGQLSSSCVVTRQPLPQRSCAIRSSDCTNGTDCSLSVFGGFSGSDRHSLSFTTGLQLGKINQFALSTYFYNALTQLTRLKDSISTGGQIGSTAGSSTAGEAA